MITVIQWCINHWRLSIYSIAGIFLLVILAWLGHLRHENQNLKNDIQQFQQQAINIQARLTATQIQAQKTIDAMARAQQKKRLQSIQIEKLKEKIHHVAPKDDGAVAPVLRNLLDQLRQPEPHNID